MICPYVGDAGQRTRCAGCDRTDGDCSCRASRTGWSHGSGRSYGPLRSLRSGCTRGAVSALRDREVKNCVLFGSYVRNSGLGAGGTGSDDADGKRGRRSFRSHGSGWSGYTLRSLGSLWPSGPLRSLRPGQALRPLRPSQALRPSQSLRPLLPGRALTTRWAGRRTGRGVYRDIAVASGGSISAGAAAVIRWTIIPIVWEKHMITPFYSAGQFRDMIPFPPVCYIICPKYRFGSSSFCAANCLHRMFGSVFMPDRSIRQILPPHKNRGHFA